MAGSKDTFLYTSDTGQQYAIEGDEGNIEAIMGAAVVRPPSGAPKIARTADLRHAVYRNAATGATRKVPVLTQAALAALPVAVDFFLNSTGIGGSAVSFVLTNIIGEAISRYTGGDTGLTDGD
jgi:hypothetical protein